MFFYAISRFSNSVIFIYYKFSEILGNEKIMKLICHSRLPKALLEKDREVHRDYTTNGTSTQNDYAKHKTQTSAPTSKRPQTIQQQNEVYFV